jgi:hypothetical protein
MKRTRLAGWLLALLTAISGTLLPIIQFEYNRSYDFYVNAVWDSLYGIGYEIGIAIFHELVLSRPVGTVGFMLWPACLCSTVAYLVRKLLDADCSRKRKTGVLPVFVATLLLNVPVRSLDKSIPSFNRSYSVNY